jgi:hypothetical protein
MRGRGARSIRQMNACARKQRYPTRAAAETAQRLIQAEGKPLNVYECLVCRGFHVGGTPIGRRPDR